jgi:mitosis inhibitor protein kinase SWE1
MLHSKAKTEVHLKKQTKTKTELSIADFNDSGVAFNDNDSDCEGNMDNGDTLFLEGPSLQPLRMQSTHAVQPSHGDNRREDIAEAISPGGHVTKRRTRSRPVSLDLLECVRQTGSPAPNLVGHSTVLPLTYLTSHSQKHKKLNNAITFPSSHSRGGSQSSTSYLTSHSQMHKKSNNAITFPSIP